MEGGAFTLGGYIVGPKGFRPDFKDHLFVHEYGHYLQSQKFGLAYMSLIALPSVTDFYLVGDDKEHDARWYEANASLLASKYFDKKYGSELKDYYDNSPDHFDKYSFMNYGNSPYLNPRDGQNYGRNSVKGNFHKSDVPISILYSGGMGLFGF